jgi:hypothetical protein
MLGILLFLTEIVVCPEDDNWLKDSRTSTINSQRFDPARLHQNLKPLVRKCGGFFVLSTAEALELSLVELLVRSYWQMPPIFH